MGLVYLEFGCRLTIGLVFLISSAGKVGSPARFADFRSEIAAMRVVPAGLTRAAAASVCIVEIAVVGLLVSGFTAVVGFVVGSALLAVFSAAILRTVRSGVGARCHCFGFRSGRLGIRHLYRNGFLMAVCAAGVLAATAGPDWTPAWVDLLPVTLLALVAVALLVFMDDLVDLRRVDATPGRGRF
ncbi:MauE/DoxX family redox-associated membrane protein [Micromonospora profundi]|uniref:MauE/DoxX family redox-associated membrane protein n=1 Tax=Micromonospora profundi TaxID=1420889 RepID=UPI003804AA01